MAREEQIVREEESGTETGMMKRLWRRGILGSAKWVSLRSWPAIDLSLVWQLSESSLSPYAAMFRQNTHKKLIKMYPVEFLTTGGAVEEFHVLVASCTLLARTHWDVVDLQYIHYNCTRLKRKHGVHSSHKTKNKKETTRINMKQRRIVWTGKGDQIVILIKCQMLSSTSTPIQKDVDVVRGFFRRCLRITSFDAYWHL